MKEDFRVTHSHLTNAESKNPVGEINKLNHSEFNDFFQEVSIFNEKVYSHPEARSFQEEIEKKHFGIMEKAGFRVNIVRYKIFPALPDLKIQVSDPWKLIKFLKTTNGQEDQETRNNINELPGFIFDQIYTQYGRLQGPDKETVELSRGLAGITKEFARLSIPIINLGDCPEHAKAQSLKEYVSLVKSGILANPQDEESSSDRYFSLEPQVLAKTWGNAFEILDLLKKNPSAVSLYEATLNTLIFEIEEALEDNESTIFNDLKKVLMIAREVLFTYIPAS